MRRDLHHLRPRRPFAAVAFALLLALMPALSGGPAMAKGEDATPLLQQSASAMAAVKSFSFKLTTPKGQSTILDNLELRTVEGAVLRPDRFQASVTVKVAIAELTIKTIGIGTRLWVTNPLQPGDKFVEASAGGDSSSSQTLTELLNPDKIFLQAVSMIQKPVIDGTETIYGAETTRVTGTVNLDQLSQFANVGTPEAATSMFVLGEKKLTVWIDAGNRVVRLEFAGPLTTNESADVVRRLDLKDFDQPVDIQAPAV